MFEDAARALGFAVDQQRGGRAQRGAAVIIGRAIALDAIEKSGDFDQLGPNGNEAVVDDRARRARRLEAAVGAFGAGRGHEEVKTQIDADGSKQRNISVTGKSTMARSEKLIVVDERNRAVGEGEKWAVHREGRLHRAFSIFLVDAQKRVLLQRRSGAKYHSAGLWANSCCGHPRPGERTDVAARRRLREELGAEAPLRYAFRARYRTELPNGLIENEIVYVFFGPSPRALALNPEEVSEAAWATVEELQRDIARRPRRYAYWLRYYMGNHAAAVQRGVAVAARRQGGKSHPRPRQEELAGAAT